MKRWNIPGKNKRNKIKTSKADRPAGRTKRARRCCLLSAAATKKRKEKKKKKVVRSNVKFDVIFPEKDWQSKVRHPMTEECPGRGKKRPFKKNWSQFLSECRRKFLRHNCLNLKFRCKSWFRLPYSLTSTMQRLEISRQQSLEISRFCILEISRHSIVEVDE